MLLEPVSFKGEHGIGPHLLSFGAFTVTLVCLSLHFLCVSSAFCPALWTKTLPQSVIHLNIWSVWGSCVCEPFCSSQCQPSFYHHETPSASESKVYIPQKPQVYYLQILVCPRCLPALRLVLRWQCCMPLQKVAVKIRTKTLLVVDSAFLVFFSKTKAGGPSCRCCPGKAGTGVQGIKGEAASGRT